MAAPAVLPILVSLLAGQAGGFTFEGARVSAATERPEGVFVHGPLPYSDTAERGFGSAQLEATDRLRAPWATYGDQGSLSATFRLGGDTYTVELTQVGFPPRAAAPGGTVGAPPAPPGVPIGGGVTVDAAVNGGTGVGYPWTTEVRAAASVWGTGRVLRNGRLVTDNAVVWAVAASAGTFADDLSGRVLRAARPGDHELHVLAYNLPVDLEPRGFVQFVFERVRIGVDGAALPESDFLGSTEAGGDVASRTPIPSGASLLGVSVTSVPAAGAQAGTGGSGRPTDARAVPDSTGVATPGVATVGQAAPPAGRQTTSLTPATDEPGTPGVATTDQAPQPSTGREGTAESALPATGTPGVATSPSPGPVAGTQRTSAAASTAPAAPGTPGVATTGSPPGAPVLDAQGRAVADTRPGTLPPAGGVQAQGTGGTGVGATQGFTVTGAPTVSGLGAATASGATGTAVSTTTTLSTAGSFSTPTSAAATFGAPPTGAQASGMSPTLATGPGTADVPGARRELSPGLPATPPVAGSTAATAASPLVSTPAPINSGAPTPLLSSPAPLNGTPPPALPATPAPANAAPVSSPTAGGASTAPAPAPSP